MAADDRLPAADASDRRRPRAGDDEAAVDALMRPGAGGDGVIDGDRAGVAGKSGDEPRDIVRLRKAGDAEADRDARRRARIEPRRGEDVAGGCAHDRDAVARNRHRRWPPRVPFPRALRRPRHAAGRDTATRRRRRRRRSQALDAWYRSTWSCRGLRSFGLSKSPLFYYPFPRRRATRAARPAPGTKGLCDKFTAAGVDFPATSNPTCAARSVQACR